MARGWHVWVTRSTAVPCPLLLLLAACTPAARAPSASGPAAALSPIGSAAAPFESGRSYAFGQMLAREEERNAALQQQLDERGRQIEQLQAEVQQLRRQAAERLSAAEQDAPDTAAAVAQPAPAPAPLKPGTEQEGEPAATPVVPATAQAEGEVAPQTETQGEPAAVASLRVALTQEQQRREAVETELARLKEETSTPPLADSGDPATELAAAKSQINDLRDALAAERVERERMADALRALQEQASHAPQPDTPESTPENTELQARIDSLRAEKEAATESFNRSLAASQQRTAELERQLAASQAAAAAAANAGAAPTDGDAASVRADNQALRARLDEEHRRTEELAAKLRIATRVTDLIFKMQAQQARARPLAVQ
jgi:predicted RNase H-like nuclease (RuvC/YqgF family)